MPMQGYSLSMLQQFLLGLLTRKLSWIALGWAVVYFSTQRLNDGILMLFAPFVGALAGLVIGWVVGDNAVEDAGFSGLALWVILVLACWFTLAFVEIVLGTIMAYAADWHMYFGRWMLLSSAMILSLAAAVWRASADH